STPAIPIENRFQSAPLYLAWVCVVVCWVLLKHSPAGLWLGFAGEHPEALETAGGLGEPGPLGGGALRGGAGGPGGRAAAGFPFLSLFEKHDRGTRLHGPGSAHFWKMEADPDRPGVPPVWIRRSSANPTARR